MKRRILTLSFICGFCALSHAQYISQVWSPDKGDGTYINPIIHADYSDVDVCASGEDFYMTASCFNNTPGLPILHSKDLVNWQLVGHALKELTPTEHFQSPHHGKGVYAPSIRYHKGEFYIYWGDPDFGIYMVKTKDPHGKWEKPILVKAGKGMIDPTPLWDEDGKIYLVYAWANSRIGINSVLTVCELNAEGTEVITEPILVFDGNDGTNHTVEGPKFYKQNGYYYIFAPAGGVSHGWQLALRSKNVYGPYECRIVMAQGKTDINGPHQGAWVKTDKGESWFIHFQDKGLYGRVIHLNPMKWQNDWPVIGKDKNNDGCGEPVKRYRKPHVEQTYPIVNPMESDEFDQPAIGLQWQWNANYQPAFGFPSSSGYMRIYNHLYPKDTLNLWTVPNLFLQKFMAPEFTATTKLKVTARRDGQQGGLVVMGNDYCYISLEKEGEQFILKQVICRRAEKGTHEEVTRVAELSVNRKYKASPGFNYEREIYLRMEMKDRGVCHFSYSLDGNRYEQIGIAFEAEKNIWIGAKVGLFSTSPNGRERGWIDADWFRIHR